MGVSKGLKIWLDQMVRKVVIEAGGYNVQTFSYKLKKH